MKRLILLLPILALATALIATSCETEPKESCEQDEICDGKSVTACCTDDECYYTYNDQKYGDDAESLAQLAIDLGCSTATSPNYEEDLKDIVARLQTLQSLVRLKLY